MAVVSGIPITVEQAKELGYYAASPEFGEEGFIPLSMAVWPDGSITIDDGDHIVVEFVIEPDTFSEELNKRAEESV
jgi:hypothetical protein